MHRLKSTLTLIARFPVQLTREPDFSRSDFWMPVIGLLAGASALCVYGAASVFMRQGFLPAILAVLAQYLLFNLFHFDGLLDTADAFGAAGASEERRLEILKDSRSGAFAVFAGIMVILVKTGSIVSLADIFFPGTRISMVWIALLASPVAGRMAAALVPVFSAPARSGGLGVIAKNFRAFRIVSGTIVSLTALIAGAAVAQGMIGGMPTNAVFALVLPVGILTVVLLTGCIVGIHTARLYRNGMGGYTGDALGFAVEVGESVVLIASVLAVSAF